MNKKWIILVIMVFALAALTILSILYRAPTSKTLQTVKSTEELEDGTCLVVDFKSKRQVEHVKDDINTCLQVVLYAYLMEKRGIAVSGAEYRYIRLGETVTCRFDDEIKRQLSERLDYFRKCMESGEFPLPEPQQDGKKNEDPCKYCKYSEICGKSIGEGADE